VFDVLVIVIGHYRR